MRFIKIFLVALLLFVVLGASAQKKIRRTNNFTSYKDHIHEFGYAFNVSYLKYERSFAPHLQLYYSRNLTSFFALGVGYGGIYDEHLHNTFSLKASFRLIDDLVFAIKPGVVFKTVKGNPVVVYSVGFETKYEIEITESINIGPMLEIDVIQDDINYLMGFHMGFTF